MRTDLPIGTSPEVEAAFDEIEAAGFVVFNFGIGKRQVWWASLRDKKGREYPLVQGPEPEEALRRALEVAREGR